jgi:uncharacterized protein (TIGR02996 family)
LYNHRIAWLRTSSPVDEEAAFLHAIIDRPDADAPRLVFADWLDEQGQFARAEFIRVQIALHGENRHEYDASRFPLSMRYHTLHLRERQVRDRQPLPTPDWPSDWRYEYRRGFVETIGPLSCRDFWSVADAVFAANPLRTLALDEPAPTDTERTPEELFARLDTFTPLGRLKRFVLVPGLTSLADARGLLLDLLRPHAIPELLLWSQPYHFADGRYQMGRREHSFQEPAPTVVMP